jgi:predicted RNA-binding protein YlqC (UPF0109 family)
MTASSSNPQMASSRHQLELADVPQELRVDAQEMNETMTLEYKAPEDWRQLIEGRDGSDHYYRCLVRVVAEFLNSPPNTVCALVLGIKDAQPDVNIPRLTHCQRIQGVEGATQAAVEEELRWIMTNRIVGDVSMQDVVVEIVPQQPKPPLVRIYVRSVTGYPELMGRVAYIESDGSLRMALRVNRLDAERRGEVDPETVRHSFKRGVGWEQSQNCHDALGLAAVMPRLVASNNVRIVCFLRLLLNLDAFLQSFDDCKFL